MTKKMIVLAAFLAAAGCAHQAVKPNAGPDASGSGTGAGAGAQSNGAGQGSASGQSMSGASSAQSLSHTVHFAFNSSAVDGDNKAIVKANAQYMLAHPNAHVRLEGNTDERGTEEYNLALGWRRAKSVKSMMEVLGVPAGRISTISYGKDHPVAMGHDSAAWAKNRRVDFDYNQ